MYRPHHYREDSTEALLAIVRAQPFATLVSSARLSATHLPLIVAGDGDKLCLLGHFARGNSQWVSLTDGDPVLAIFLAEHAYVSPSWYQAEADVPTWNYVAVHARGRWRAITDALDLRRLLSQTVDYFEQARPDPWALESLDKELANSLQRGVVGFCVEVEDLVGVRKLSQDKCTRDREGVIAGLEESSDASSQCIAARMRGGQGALG